MSAVAPEAPTTTTPTTTTAGGAPATSPLHLRDIPGLPSGAVDDVVGAAAEYAATVDEKASFPTEVVDRMRATGLLGLLVPAEYGGPGGRLEDVLAVSYRIARECMSSAMIFAMHHQQLAALVEYGSDELRAAVLPRIARGEVYLASVTTEAGSGGHLMSADAALAGEDALQIDRMAPIVTGGEHADAYLVTMRAGEDEGADRVSLVYADASQLDAEALGGWDPLGMRATRSVPMRLRGEVPPENLVGEPGRFRDVVVTSFGPLAHLGWATCWLGTASGALSRSVSLLRKPSEREKRDGLSSDLLRHRLSQIRQRLDVVHATIAHALGVFRDTPDAELGRPPVQMLLNAVKLSASEQCVAAVDELIEIVGMRHGYLRDSPVGLERALRDLRSASLNYSNDRLHAADGAMALLDGEVHYA